MSSEGALGPALTRARAREIEETAFWSGVAVCVAAVGAFLLLRLTAWPPHEDETLALFVGRGSLGSLLDVVLGERGGAPLHFLLAWAAAHSGGGLTALRLGSAMFALASLPLVAALAARLADRTVALAATAIASASWMLLFHGIYGRMYSLFLFTSALSYLALLWALERGGKTRFALFALAALATVATHPYGALVVASQGLFALLARRRLRATITTFAAIGIVGIPFWYTDLRLAGRFDVGVGGGGDKLGAPLPVFRYLAEVAGDFTIGWPVVLAPILIVAAIGFRVLYRQRHESAALVAAVIATPTLAFLVARLGSSASPESRHLIFVLPFFVTLIATALVAGGRRWATLRPAFVVLGAAALVAGEVGWAWEKTPQVFSGDIRARSDAREAAGAWLARTSRPNDIFFGYEPVYLEAWERDENVAHVVIPRADAKLAASELGKLERPLGRGVWVFDASDTNNCPCARRLWIELRLPRPDYRFDARVFGPYLVIRSVGPTVTARNFLAQSAQVMIVGKSLFIGDADVNFVTVRRAAARLDPRRR